MGRPLGLTKGSMGGMGGGSYLSELAAIAILCVPALAATESNSLFFPYLYQSLVTPRPSNWKDWRSFHVELLHVDFLLRGSYYSSHLPLSLPSV